LFCGRGIGRKCAKLANNDLEFLSFSLLDLKKCAMSACACLHLCVCVCVCKAGGSQRAAHCLGAALWLALPSQVQLIHRPWMCGCGLMSNGLCRSLPLHSILPLCSRKAELLLLSNGLCMALGAQHWWCLNGSVKVLVFSAARAVTWAPGWEDLLKITLPGGLWLQGTPH